RLDLPEPGHRPGTAEHGGRELLLSIGRAVPAARRGVPGMSRSSIDRPPRRRPSVWIVAALCLVSCGVSEPAADVPAAPLPAAPPASSTGGPAASPSGARTPLLTEEGWGPIRIGMTRAEVVAAAGEDANPDAVG